MSKLNLAIVGATGAVGTKILEKLLERKFPFDSIKLLASKRSAGKEVEINGKKFVIEETTAEAFDQVDIAFFSAGGTVSELYAHEAVKRGAVVIDNTSAFRMTEGIPLVVPEVNGEALKTHQGIIANPNCSTIQMVAALEPIRKKYGLKRIIVSTYQAVSGAGVEAIDELEKQSVHMQNRTEVEANILPSASGKKHYPIAFNAIPQIDAFGEAGYTLEELKMINETKKIFNLPDLQVAATCVRLPIVTGHSESLYVEIEKDNVTVEEIHEALRNAESVQLQDDIDTQTYPMPLFAEGQDDIFVGRVRKDLDNQKGFHLWIVADNLLKGAALNSVQIAEKLVKLNAND